MKSLYEFLKYKRKELGLSLREAAKLIGISHSYLNTLEKGLDPRNGSPIKPTPETLELISQAYKIDYNQLMEKAGYIKHEENNNLSKLTRRDEREIEKILEKTRKQLESAEGLMFDGKPASPEAVQSILDSMRIGMELAKQRNKEKYTPKKYKHEQNNN